MNASLNVFFAFENIFRTLMAHSDLESKKGHLMKDYFR